MAAKCGANLIVGTSGRSPLCARVGVLKPAAATNHRGSQDNPPNDKSRRIVRRRQIDNGLHNPKSIESMAAMDRCIQGFLAAPPG